MLTQEFTLLKTLPILEQEDVSLAVVLLQRLLVFYRYFSCTQVNKVFAGTIDYAVRQFQHDNGLYEDGIVGYLTSCTKNY